MTFINSLSADIDNFLNIISPYYAHLIVSLHILYAFAIFGFISAKSKYIDYVHSFIQIFICIFLMLKFHPFRNHELHKNDAKIIFGSAVFLILNIGFTKYLISYVEKYAGTVYKEDVTKLFGTTKI